MTNEELNTALYKKVFTEAFVKERNEALFSLDRKKIEAYMIKYGETEITQTPDNVFWVSVYKAICGIKDAPEAIVNDAYGDEAACIIVDERGKLVLDDVYNGFDDDTLRLLDLEVKEVPEMPDPAISVQDMRTTATHGLASFPPVRRRLRRLWRRAARFTVFIPITPRACA